jgi:hypothetical protein
MKREVTYFDLLLLSLHAFTAYPHSLGLTTHWEHSHLKLPRECVAVQYLKQRDRRDEFGSSVLIGQLAMKMRVLAED